jgi:hypothetical protein
VLLRDYASLCARAREASLARPVLIISIKPNQNRQSYFHASTEHLQLA